MSREIKYRKAFKKQFKKRFRDPKWQRVFHEPLAKELDVKQRAAWDFIIDCLINQQQIPNYFYAHPLLGFQNTANEIKHRLGIDRQTKLKVLELHFDGHNGDHLLVYADHPDVVVLIAIGTHSDIF